MTESWFIKMIDKANDLILAGKHHEAFVIFSSIIEKDPLSQEAHTGMLQCSLALKYFRHSIRLIYIINGIFPSVQLGHSLFILKNSLITHIRNKKDIRLLKRTTEIIQKCIMISCPINKSPLLEIQSDLLYELGEKESGLKLKGEASILKVKNMKKDLVDLAELSSGKLPDFLIFGAQKTGTTALYEFLTKHPDIYPALRKEIFFFSNDSLYDRSGKSGHLRWYVRERLDARLW